MICYWDSWLLCRRSAHRKPSLIALNWSSQMGKAYPNVFMVFYWLTNYNILTPSQPPSPLWSRQSRRWWKEPTWMKHQGRHQAREASRALKNPPLLCSIPTCKHLRSEDSCLHKTRSATITKLQTLQRGTFQTSLILSKFLRQRSTQNPDSAENNC